MRPTPTYDNRSYEDLVLAWKAIRRTHGLSVREVACVGAQRTLLVAELGSTQAPAIHVTAGVHGDEPAGPWALLSIVRDGLLDPRFAYRIWPCTNPSGYQAGTRENAEGNDVNRSFSRGGTTPESKAIITANRDRKYFMALDLHEDFEAEGFYCYEPVVDGEALLGRTILDAIEFAGFPLQPLDHLFDLGYPKDPAIAASLRTLEPGRVLVNVPEETRHFRGLPLSLYLLRSATHRYVTVETPRRRPWDERIAMHRVASAAVLAEAATLAEK